MSFLSPVFLRALPLAALPVIIHLLNRRRGPVVRWGAMRFLREAAGRRRRPARWEDRLLMLVRAAAVAAMVLALARPLVRSVGPAPAGARDVVVVLDTSLSAARVPAGAAGPDESLFAGLLDRADAVLGRLDDRDEVRVLLASTMPQWLIREPVPATPRNVARIRSQWRQVRPTLAAADLPRCALEAVHAEAGEAAGRRIVAILTDGQARAWRTGAAPAWRAVRAAAEALDPPAALNAVLAGDPAAPRANLSVESLSAARGVAAPGEPVTLTALVRNTGTVPVGATSVRWSAGGEPLGVAALAALKPGEFSAVTLACTFDAPGVRRICCAVDCPDDLALDNSESLVVEIIDRVPVLVIEGAPRADAIDSDSGCFLAALGRAFPGGSPAGACVFEPTGVDAARAEGVSLDGFAAVVCLNAARLSPGFVDRLETFIRRGGGLWWVLGDRNDRDFFNVHVYAGGRGLCPLSLGTPVGDARSREASAAIRPPSPAHPATQLLADTQRLDLDRGRLYRHHRFAPADRGVSVLLETDAGEPLAVEHRAGGGRVIVQAFPMDLSWSDLPLCQAFVVMVREWLGYLAQPFFNCYNLQPGDPIAARVPEGVLPAEPARIIRPDGTESPVPASVQDGCISWRFTDTRVPGPYRLAVGGGRRVLPFEVCRDSRESDLTLLSDAEKLALQQAAGLRFVNDPLADAPGGAAERRLDPMWAWLLAAVVGFMLIELVLAGRLARRRRASIQGPARGEMPGTRPAAGLARGRESVVAG